MTQISTSDYLRLLKYRKNSYIRLQHSQQVKKSRHPDLISQNRAYQEDEILLKSKLDPFEAEKGIQIMSVHQKLKTENPEYQKNLRLLHQAAEQLKNQFLGQSQSKFGKFSQKITKADLRNIKLKAQEKQAIYEMKQRAATIIQTCFKSFQARMILSRLKYEKWAGRKILKFLRMNLKRKQKEKQILLNAKTIASAYKLTQFIRKVADWMKRDKHYKACFEKIKGLLYGHKVRTILRLDKMIELRSNIENLEFEIEQQSKLENSPEALKKIMKLKDEVLYEKKLFCNMIEKYWERGFVEFGSKDRSSYGRAYSGYKQDYLTETLIQGAAKTAKRMNRMSTIITKREDYPRTVSFDENQRQSLEIQRNVYLFLSPYFL